VFISFIFFETHDNAGILKNKKRLYEFDEYWLALTVLVYMVQHLFIRTSYLIDDKVSINQLFTREVVSPKNKIACCNNKYADSQRTAIPRENKLIHEHDLVPARIKKCGFLVRCTNCGIYYCELCGKAL
jgi:hypothetical protein